MAPGLGFALSEDARSRDRRFAVLSATITFLAFLPALHGGFVWDDQKNIVENPGFRSFDFRHLKWMFTTFFMGPYQPLSWLSLGLDFKFWGLKPFGFHLTNLLLHAANAALFFRVSRETLARALGKDDRAGIAALAAALFFGLHPLRVESVAWITERRDVLAGLFVLSATWAYLRRRLGVALGLYFLSLLSKASGATLPVAWLALDLYPLGRLDSRAALKEALIEKWPFFGLAFLAGVFALLGQLSAGNLVSLQAHGFSARLAQAALGSSFYIEKTLWPRHLCPLYPLPGHLALTEPRVWIATGALIGVVIALRLCRVPWRAQAALWIYYWATLLPVLGILQNGPQLMADRYSYLSCLGWTLLAAAALTQATNRWQHRVFVVPVIVLGALALGSWRQTRVWRDDDALWGAAVALHPDSAAIKLNYGLALAGKRRLFEALSIYEEASEIEPNNAMILTHQGYALLELRRYPEAEKTLKQALGLNANSSLAETYLGVALLRDHKVDEALAPLQRAVTLEPYSEQARINLGAALEAKAVQE